MKSKAIEKETLRRQQIGLPPMTAEEKEDIEPVHPFWQVGKKFGYRELEDFDGIQ